MTKKPKVEFDYQLNTSFENIQKMATNDAYNDHFSKTLYYELVKMYGKMKTARILKCFKKGVEIVNKENFFWVYTICGGDLGREAWKESNDDLFTFTERVLTYMNLMRGRGYSEIDLSSVFFYLAYFKGYRGENIPEARKWKIELAVRSIAAACICSKYNPFVVRIVHPVLVPYCTDVLGIENATLYRSVVEAYFKVFDEYYDPDLCKKQAPIITFPKVKYIIPVYQDVRRSQIAYLAKRVRTRIGETKAAVSGIEDLGKHSPELEIALEKLKQKRKLYGMNNTKLIEDMHEIEKSRVFYAFPDIKDERRYFSSRDTTVARNQYKRYRVEDVFAEQETFLETAFEGMFTIRIDCSKYNYLHEIEPLVFTAAEFFGIRKRNIFNGDLLKKRERCHIELLHMREYNKGLMDRVKDLQERVSSQFNRPVILSVQYDRDTATSQFNEDRPLYLRVISDIHADINKDRNYIFDFGNDFVINCGDTASTFPQERTWIRSFMKQGVVVAGNHLGYSSYVPELDGAQNLEKWQHYIHPRNTKNAQLEKLHDYFYNPEGVKYLSNNIKEEDGIIYIGNTLYTDFRLFGTENQAACMMEAAQKMNDFKLCTSLVRDKNAQYGWKVAQFTPEEQVKLNWICVSYIRNRLQYLKKHHNRKPVVIVTHHMPLPFCVNEKYKNDPLSAAFANDLRWLLDLYPDIRLWCSGHTHEPYDFIYNGTRFVCEPWGYYNENGFDEKNYGNRIPIVQVKDQRSWRKLLTAEITMGLVKDYGCSEAYTAYKTANLRTSK